MQKKRKSLDIWERTYADTQVKLQNQRNLLIAALTEICKEYNEVQCEILDVKLDQWKRHQRKAGVGDENELKVIQNLCEKMYEIIQSVKCMVESISINCADQEATKQSDLFMKIGILFQNLISSTFMIVKQPPQVYTLKS